MSAPFDAIVVGSGPNGLAAAITLARQRLSVLLIEGKNEVGGAVRSQELTLPGFLHDTCSAIYPLALASPFFQSLDLRASGLEWVHPSLPLTHPLDHGQAAILDRSPDVTAGGLGPDREPYLRTLGRLARHADQILPGALQPLLRLPGHPWQMSKFGWLALQSADGFCRSHFAAPAARALFAGLAAHSFLSLRAPGSAAIGLILNVLAHTVGWPLPRGGAGRLSAALGRHFQSLGGTIETNRWVKNIDDLPAARAILFDVTPRQLLSLAAHRFPPRYCAALGRFRYGPGVFKVDYALNARIPWKNSECQRAGTVHVGGALEEITVAEEEVAHGRLPDRPFVLVTQPTLFDPSRAPAGRHIAWAYCHVPNGSPFDMTERLENQIERFAPGFRDCILARSAQTCRDLEAANPNLIGGDINGGRADLKQMLIRPVLSPAPYATPAHGIYLCSASTPPGGGVHGMAGYHAARHALRAIFHFRTQSSNNNVED